MQKNIQNITAVIEYIEAHLTEKLDLDTIADAVHYSKYHLHRMFADMTGLTAELCGKSRPIHFRGVCTVVAKLFNIVRPDRAYFGQKDGQQLSVIRRMVRDLDFDIEIVGCPIVREADGLAKSSRNTYLSEEERKAALVLSRAVRLGKDMAENGEKSADVIVKAMTELIDREPLARIDYVKAVNAVNIEPVSVMEPPVMVAMAVFIGKTRLIDNFVYEGEDR